MVLHVRPRMRARGVSPVVVRLEGTNAEEAKTILSESGLDIIPANDMKDAAQKVVDAAIKN